MKYASFDLRRAAILAIAGNVLGISACSGGTSSLGLATRGVTAAAINSQGYTWYKVDDSLGASNEVTGINDSREIVGNYTNNLTGTGGTCGIGTENSGGTCSDCPLPSGTGQPSGIGWSSYTSSFSGSTPYSNISPIDYPDATWQYMYGISNPSSQFNNQTIEVGCLVYPGGGNGGELNGTWGVVDNAGQWSIISKNEFSNNCAVGAIGELLAIDLSSTNDVAIGYFNDHSNKCDLRPWQDTPGDNHAAISLSGTFASWTNIEATGITTSVSPTIVGTATTTSTTVPQVGWYAPLYGTSHPQPKSYPGAPFTAFTGVAIKSGPLIVGWYTDSSSNTHGLVFRDTTSKTWTSIDAPFSDAKAGYTIISGVNINGDICGWYEDRGKNFDGFVAIAYGVLQKRHHGREAKGRDYFSATRTQNSD